MTEDDRGNPAGATGVARESDQPGQEPVNAGASAGSGQSGSRNGAQALYGRLDPDQVNAFALKVWKYKQGELVSLMIHLGDRLGIYRTLMGMGPVTVSGLAEASGLKERWLLEWLRGQAAAGLVEYRGAENGGEPRFELGDAAAAVLANEESSVAFAGGAFGYPPSHDVIDGLAEAFRTGIGLSYQQLGPCAAHRTERMLGPWTRQALVPRIIPALDGVEERLREGIDVVDVGCGGGVALLSLARAFPASRFVGIDPSEHAIDIARERTREAGAANAEWRIARGEELPGKPSFDLVVTFDCVHDMTRPDLVIAAIRRAIRHDGTWLIKDIRSSPRFEDNLRNPMLALLYGFSVSACMSSALSEPDGLGLGTLGFNPVVAERMVREGGFTRFRMHDFDDPANLYYEVRP